MVDKLNINYSGTQINAEPISVPASSPFTARTIHNRILKEETSTIEVWQNSDKSGSWLTEEPYTGTVSATGKFQVDYDGVEDGDIKYRNTILFHAAQANTNWFIWYKSIGDVYDADDFNAKIEKIVGGTEDNLIAQDSTGGVKDAGKKVSDLEPKIDPKGTAFNKNFGTTDDTVCEGDDSRLSNARTPLSHKNTHITGGSDIIPNAVSGGNSGLMSGSDKQNLDDAVTKKHTQNTDQYLDFGGANQVAVGDVKDAVAKKHEHANKTELDTYSATTQDLEYWVDGTNGSDNNDGSYEHPFATINKALGLIPQVVNHSVDIYILDGTYAETIGMAGKLGKGYIIISGDYATTGVQIDSIYGENNTCALYFSTLEVLSTDYDSVYFENNPGMLDFYAVNSTQTSSSFGGFRFKRCPSVSLSYCTISNRKYAVSSTFSNVCVGECAGSNNNAAFYSYSGIIFDEYSSIGGNNPNILYAGGQILSTQLANRDEEAVEGNLAKFDSSGNPVDSGIASNTVPIATTANRTYYVNATTGSDGNDGSSGSPFKTIAHAISLIPQVINHTVTINVADGSYSEGITLSGFMGEGLVSVVGNTTNPENVVLSGQVIVQYCACHIQVQGMKTTWTGMGSSGTAFVGQYNPGRVSFSRVITDAFNPQSFGMSLNTCPTALVFNSTFSNKQYGIWSYSCSSVFSSNNGGTNNNIGLYASNSVIMKNGTQPGGATAETAVQGGEIR